MPVTKPQERRTAAVQALHARVTPAPEYAIALTVEQIVAGIRELAMLSRSARWSDACESWAGLIEAETAEDPGRLSWAYLQGSVWFGYATEGLRSTPTKSGQVRAGPGEGNSA